MFCESCGNEIEGKAINGLCINCYENEDEDLQPILEDEEEYDY